MKFSLWTQYGALNSKPVFEAFKQSLDASGYTVTENDPTADVDVIWSVLWCGKMAANKQIFHNGKPTIVLEVGGIYRGTTWKVCLNGIGYSNCMPNVSRNKSRDHPRLPLEPWKEPGENILVCCQHPKSHMWENMPVTAEWVDNVITRVRRYSNKHIIVRPHPRYPIKLMHDYDNVSLQTPKKIQGSYDDFDLSFENLHAVVSWSSNPGPQAIVAGVPAFVGPNSLAFDVANTNLENIENPERPDRSQWIIDYSYSEYTLNEISQGIPLRKLLKSLDI